jgi:uncharacterized protein (DUF1800 family)
MWFQNTTFRVHALGNFNVLTKAVSRDPAMLVWLDLVQSQKAKPNENFARELMELFTLGEGNYTESDIKEAARAFTGYRIDPLTQGFRFVPNQFDFTAKTFMGQTGPWNGDDIIDLIFAQPACARFLVAKLWRFFISDHPVAEDVEGFARIFRNAHFEMKPLLLALFTSERFYNDPLTNALIKSPVQFVVQGSRSLGLPLLDPQPLRNMLRRLGQEPFYPPNVKGWDGGKNWINTATLTTRYEISRHLVAGIKPGEFGVPKPQAPLIGLNPAMATATPSLLAATSNANPAMMSLGKEPAPESPMLSREKPTARPLPPLAVDHLITAKDRNQPELLVSKLLTGVIQAKPAPELVAKFTESVSAKPLPLSDDTIRELISLMLATPNYQIF